METIWTIVFALSISLGLYGWCSWALENKEAIEFVKRNSWLHPNAICYWRTIIGCFGVWQYFVIGQESLGIIVFTISAVMDGVDGLVARRCGLTSVWGETLDPLCDKLTYIPALIGFSYQGLLPADLLLIFVAIEFFGQFFARKILARLNLSGAANNFGKIKAIICFALVIYCAILKTDLGFPQIGENLLWSCIFFGLSSIAFKFIPNRFYADILSILNLICGIIGLVLAYQDHFVLATMSVMVGQVFDLFDGRMAEKYGGTRFGSRWDDGADLVSFGICPGYILFKTGDHYSWIYGSGYTIAVAYRLYRFLAIDAFRTDLPKGIFNGLPSPAGASIILGCCLVVQNDFVMWFITLAVSYLMISKIRFAHFGRVIVKRIPKPVFILGSAVFTLFLMYAVKMKDASLFGGTLICLTIIYMIIGRMMAIQIQKNFPQSAEPA